MPLVRRSLSSYSGNSHSTFDETQINHGKMSISGVKVLKKDILQLSSDCLIFVICHYVIVGTEPN